MKKENLFQQVLFGYFIHSSPVGHWWLSAQVHLVKLQIVLIVVRFKGLVKAGFNCVNVMDQLVACLID